MAKILIKNGLIYDGSGGAPVKKDIVIQNKKIARLGSFPKKDADLTINATGMAITPGLIDVSFKAGNFEKLIRVGVTTAIGNSESVPQSHLHPHPVKEFFKILQKTRLAVNFGTLVSYSSIRRLFTGDIGRDLTVRETESVKNTITQSLKEGAFGFSAALNSPYANRIPTREILEAARIAAKFRRVCAIEPRYTDERLMTGLEEILEIGRDSGASMEINHFQPLSEFSTFYEEALTVVEKKRAQSHVDFDIYPEDAAFAPIYSFLPDWLFAESMEETLKVFKEKTVRERILNHLQKTKLDGVMLAEAPAHLKFLEGKSLDDFAKNHGLSKARALFRLMVLTGLKANIFRRSVDKKILEKYLENQRTIISPGLESLFANGEKENFLARAKQNGKVPLEKIVARTTGLPAAKYKIEKRGLIKENYWADLVLWENWKPRTVFINGLMAMRDGEVINKKSGLVLRAN
ncbi:MAG: hypothetical protein ABSE68_03435 [Minisyncoccia bacterium]